MATGEIELIDVFKSLGIDDVNTEAVGLNGPNSLGRTGKTQPRLSRADLDNTRYYGKPGEIISSWTTDVDKLPAAAAPLAVGGIFSLTGGDNVGGLGLKITGGGVCGPLGLIRVGAKPIDIAIEWSSAFDDPVAANNTPIARWRAISKAGNDLGNVNLPVAPLMKAATIRTDTFVASTTPGVGTVDLPANTQYIRPIVGNPGPTTTGQLSVYNISERQRTETIATLIGAAPSVNTSALTSQLALLNAAGNSERITLQNLLTIFKGIIDPMTYPAFLSGLKVDTVSNILVLDDQQRDTITIQCLDADIAINFQGKTADFIGTNPCAYQFAGEIKTYKAYGKNAVSIAARSPEGKVVSFPTKIDITLGRLTDDFVQLPIGVADSRMAYWPDPVDPRFRAAVRTFLNTLNDFGILSKLTYLFIPGSTAANNAINLANPAGKKLIYYQGASGAGVETVPYSHVKFNGSDSYADTQLLAAELGWDTNGHFLATKLGDTTITGSTYAMGNSPNLLMNPNRTATLGGVRSGSGLNTVNASPGGWLAMNRSIAAGIDIWAEDVKTVIADRVLASVPGGSLFIGATNSAGTPAGFLANKIRFLCGAYTLGSDLSVQRIRSASQALLNACDAILAAPNG